MVLPPAAYDDLTNGLVLHLSFDTGLSDSSGQGNDAVATGTPAFIPGKIGPQAIHLGNTNGAHYLSVANTPALTFNGGDSFSVSFWVNYTVGFNDLPIMGNAHNSTYNGGWVITEHNGHPTYTLFDTTGLDADSELDWAAYGPACNDGLWHNWVFSFERATLAGNASTYVDGVLVDSHSIPAVTSIDTGNPIVMGNDPSGAYGVSGAFSLDDVGIWDRPLTALEAESIYTAGQNGHSFDVSGPVTLAINGNGSGGLTLTWTTGNLQSASALTGPWQNVQGASAPSYAVTPVGASMFYRIHP